MTAFLAGIVTFVFTTVLTIAGVGAAFILIPVFLAFGIEIHTAMATALLLNAVAMSVASVRFVRHRLVVWPLAVPVLLVASVLSPVGAWVGQGLDRTTLLWTFVAFLLLAAGVMLAHQPKPLRRQARMGPLLGVGAAVGGVAGFLGGLLGVGGGNVVVPALVAMGVEPKKASATTAFVVIFSSLTGFLAHASMAGIHLPLLAWTVAGSAAGAQLGAWWMTDRLQGSQVKRVIGLVLVAIAARVAWGLLFP